MDEIKTLLRRMLGMDGYIPSAEKLLREWSSEFHKYRRIEWSPVVIKHWTTFDIMASINVFFSRYPHLVAKIASAAVRGLGILKMDFKG